MSWISFQEQWPVEDSLIIVWDSTDNSMDVAFVFSPRDIKRINDCMPKLPEDDNITHWMYVDFPDEGPE
jgi:hypothetical protein